MSPPVKIAFASCFKDHVHAFLDRFCEVAPDAELWVVSEFQPPRGRWIPYRVDRSARENQTALRAALDGREIAFTALSLQPGSPYGAMRRMALRIAPLRTLLYNENLDHYTLRPRSWPSLLRYLAWKTREYLWWQTHPGGDLYTLLWRLRHPREFDRPLAYMAARKAGRKAAAHKRKLSSVPPNSNLPLLPPGISVVIPTRDGRALLEQLLPILATMLEDRSAEVILIDNGSQDDTAAFITANYPAARLEIHPEPLTFARAVNRGIAAARYSQTLLLNNDMRPHAGFLDPLLRAFDRIPNLFCATSQIFFPEGQRREETGKAVMPSSAGPHDFPVSCGLPIEGEDESYVLYGSGGCSLYDTAKLRALGMFGEIYEPAYVEDLDVGVRAWQRGWPTVFAASSRVTHFHRATTSRFFTPEQLEQITERNYLRFLARAVGNADLFETQWRRAIDRLNWKAAMERHAPSLGALRQAADSIRYIEPAPAVEEALIFAIGSGDVAVFPGRAAGGRGLATVLIASSYIPFPLSHGGAVRMYNLMRQAASEFGQVLVTFVDELHTPPAELLDICLEIVQVRRTGSHLKAERGRPDVVEEFDTPAFRAALLQTIRKWNPEIVQLEFTQMAAYASDCRPAKTVLVEHDITLDLYQQLLDTRAGDWELTRQLDRWRKFETAAWGEVDSVVVMSDKDRQSVTGARKVVAIPNGVDLQRFQPSPISPDPGRLLFIGSFAHLPNLLAIDFFLKDVWPRLHEAAPVLHIIAGARHEYHHQRHRDRIGFPLDLPGLIIEGFVADVRPAYAQASIVIAPLLASAGTNIKIMEAMAMGKAVVSTSSGINGLDLAPGRDVIVENEPEALAAQILRLMADRDDVAGLGHHARRTVEERFSWEAIAGIQRDLYLGLLKS